MRPVAIRCWLRLGTAINARLGFVLLTTASSTGAIGIIMTNDNQVCASRLLRVKDATTVISPAPIGTKVTMTTKMDSTIRGPKLADMPNASSGTNNSTMLKATSVNSSDTAM
jgi:hypothetical protein